MIHAAALILPGMQDSARALARARARARVLAQARARDLARDLARDRKLWVELSGLTVSFNLWATCYILLDNNQKLIEIKQVGDLRNRLANPTQVASAFPKKQRSRREKEWQWVLDQPWSPVKMADLLLEHIPEEGLDISKEAVAKAFKEKLDAWIEKAEKAVGKKKGKQR